MMKIEVFRGEMMMDKVKGHEGYGNESSMTNLSCWDRCLKH